MLPNLVIVGAQKCGTSALHHYIGLHPDIQMSNDKELNFFIEEKNWTRGRAWYESNFSGEARVHGESSPDYTNYPAYKGVAQRMHAMVPDAKLIYMVRDPIERILSQYMHNRWTGLETRPIHQALRTADGLPMEQTRFIRRSKYYMQLSQFLEFYPRQNILILTQEDLFQRRQETLRNVFRFLGVDENFQSDGFSRLVHESKGKDAKNWIGIALSKGPQRGILRRLPSSLRRPAERMVLKVTTGTVKRPSLDDKLREEVIAILRDDLAQFRQLAGRSFAEWSV